MSGSSLPHPPRCSQRHIFLRLASVAWDLGYGVFHSQIVQGALGRFTKLKPAEVIVQPSGPGSRVLAGSI